VGPREDYGRLLRSPVAKPADATPSWIVHCFVVGRSHRGRGVAQRLLEEAVAFAADRGAAAVEGCPIDSPQDRIDTGSAWHGLASMFTRAGFVEIARRSPTRPLMRKVLAAGQ
jgi:GNAT superfamily N-acetyltransferase